MRGLEAHASDVGDLLRRVLLLCSTGSQDEFYKGSIERFDEGSIGVL